MKQIILSFINSSKNLKIIDITRVNQRSEHLISIRGKFNQVVVSDLVLSDIKLFRIWLLQLESGAYVNDFEIFLNEFFPEINII